MNIAIDARWIFSEISGIGAYTRELIRHLALLDRENRYTVIFNRQDLLDQTARDTGFASAPNFKSVLFAFGLFSPLSQLFLPGLLRQHKIDVYHSTNYLIPILAFPRNRKGRIRCVTTIHDVIPLIFPHHAPRSRKARFLSVYKLLMKEVAMRSDIIITDSNSSGADVCKHLGLAGAGAAKVKTVYCGVSDSFTSAAPEKQKTGNTRSLLYVGRLDPYKNVCGLIRIFAAVRKQCPFPVKLVIAGPHDGRYPEAPALAQELGVADGVEWTGYVDDNTLLDLYRHSDVLVHPSEYEGFGLQIVEAMACGTPVVCSNAGSLPEVAGDAAVLLDPHDYSGFVSNICRILSSENTARAMAEKGVRQAARLSWRNTAGQTLGIYRLVMEQEKTP